MADNRRDDVKPYGTPENRKYARQHVPGEPDPEPMDVPPYDRHNPSHRRAFIEYISCNYRVGTPHHKINRTAHKHGCHLAHFVADFFADCCIPATFDDPGKSTVADFFAAWEEWRSSLRIDNRLGGQQTAFGKGLFLNNFRCIQLPNRTRIDPPDSAMYPDDRFDSNGLPSIMNAWYKYHAMRPFSASTVSIANGVVLNVKLLPFDHGRARGIETMGPRVATRVHPWIGNSYDVLGLNPEPGYKPESLVIRNYWWKQQGYKLLPPDEAIKLDEEAKWFPKWT